MAFCFFASFWGLYLAFSSLSVILFFLFFFFYAGDVHIYEVLLILLC